LIYTISEYPSVGPTIYIFYGGHTAGIQRIGTKLKSTKDSRVSEILETYGDIAEAMEVFGIKRVGGFSAWRKITKTRGQAT